MWFLTCLSKIFLFKLRSNNTRLERKEWNINNQINYPNFTWAIKKYGYDGNGKEKKEKKFAIVQMLRFFFSNSVEIISYRYVHYKSAAVIVMRQGECISKRFCSRNIFQHENKRQRQFDRNSNSTNKWIINIGADIQVTYYSQNFEGTKKCEYKGGLKSWKRCIFHRELWKYYLALKDSKCRREFIAFKFHGSLGAVYFNI